MKAKEVTLKSYKKKKTMEIMLYISEEVRIRAKKDQILEMN